MRERLQRTLGRMRSKVTQTVIAVNCMHLEKYNQQQQQKAIKWCNGKTQPNNITICDSTNSSNLLVILQLTLMAQYMRAFGDFRSKRVSSAKEGNMTNNKAVKEIARSHIAQINYATVKSDSLISPVGATFEFTMQWQIFIIFEISKDEKKIFLKEAEIQRQTISLKK